MTGAVGYNNLFDQADSVAADFTPPDGFPLANCYDYRTHTAIKLLGSGDHKITIDMGAAVTAAANYLAIVGHNLGDTGATISLSHSSDDITYTELISETLTDNSVLFSIDSTTETKRYWEILITGGDSSSVVGHISVGETMGLRPIGRGFAPPVYQPYSAKNVSGIDANYLGRSIYREPILITLRQTGITPDNFRTDYVPFLNSAVRRPFFFSWDKDNHPGEAVYCWLDKKAPAPTYSHLCHMAVDMKLRAILE